MQVTDEDIIFGTLMAYREAANQGDAGLTAVLCVARNNALKHGTSLYSEVTKAFRYSSMCCPIKVNDYIEKNKNLEIQRIITSLGNFAQQNNTIQWTLWNKIKGIVAGVLSGTIEDITNGATLYYSTKMLNQCPWDASKIVYTTQIGDQKFYRELTV